jgi:hypothetical protein
MKRKITRTKDNRYCTVEIEIHDGRLSVCGEEGEIVTPIKARKLALQYWESFFEEEPEQIFLMNKKCGKKFTSAVSAAKFVIQSDGKYHGLDATEEDGKVYLLQSCGQIRDSISDFFPEVVPLFDWHLNDMRPGCSHTMQLGWGHGKTIALTEDTLTDAQRNTIETELTKARFALIDEEKAKRWALAISSKANAIDAIRAAKGSDYHITTCDIQDLCSQSFFIDRCPLVREVKTFLAQQISREIKREVFEAEIYKDCINAPCPECGAHFGSMWFKEELPPEIIQLAETVCS